MRPSKTAVNALTGANPPYAGGWSGRPRPDLALDPPTKLAVCCFQIMPGLKVDPEIRRGAEITRKAERCVGADPAAAEHDVVDPRPRRLDRLRQRIDADLHR